MLSRRARLLFVSTEPLWYRTTIMIEPPSPECQSRRGGGELISGRLGLALNRHRRDLLFGSPPLFGREAGGRSSSDWAGRWRGRISFLRDRRTWSRCNLPGRRSRCLGRIWGGRLGRLVRTVVCWPWTVLHCNKTSSRLYTRWRLEFMRRSRWPLRPFFYHSFSAVIHKNFEFIFKTVPSERLFIVKDYFESMLIIKDCS